MYPRRKNFIFFWYNSSSPTAEKKFAQLMEAEAQLQLIRNA
jgi:hypothetical protein